MVVFLNESPISLVSLFPIVCPITPRISIANSIVRECAKVHDKEWTAYQKLIGKSAMPIGYSHTTGMITWSVMHNPGVMVTTHDWELCIASLAEQVGKRHQFVLPILEPKDPLEWDERMLIAFAYLCKHQVIFATTNPGISRFRSVSTPRRIRID